MKQEKEYGSYPTTHSTPKTNRLSRNTYMGWMHYRVHARQKDVTFYNVKREWDEEEGEHNYLYQVASSRVWFRLNDNGSNTINRKLYYINRESTKADEAFHVPKRPYRPGGRIA